MTVPTIQVERRNLKILKTLKKRMHAKSYDEVIEKLLEQNAGLSGDMFGIDRAESQSLQKKTDWKIEIDSP